MLWGLKGCFAGWYEVGPKGGSYFPAAGRNTETVRQIDRNR
jgi:hypothetical protein